MHMCLYSSPLSNEVCPNTLTGGITVFHSISRASGINVQLTLITDIGNGIDHKVHRGHVPLLFELEGATCSSPYFWLWEIDYFFILASQQHYLCMYIIHITIIE